LRRKRERERRVICKRERRARRKEPEVNTLLGFVDPKDE
jgi:hypothetical protein